MRIVVRPPSNVALHKLCGEQLARGGLYLQKDLGQPQFAVVDVVVEAPDGERFDLACEVLQAFPGTATALSVKPAGRAGLDALMAHAMKHPPDGVDGPLEVVPFAEGAEGEDGADEEAADDEVPAVGDVSLIQQVAAMTINEKRHAALHGGKDLRLLIVKDHNKTLHPFVLNNPAISMDEVEAMSRMTAINPECLHLIAKNWARSPTVVRNLVKNPKTPLPDALQLVDKLAVSDLRAIAKGGTVRMALLQAARKKINS